MVEPADEFDLLKTATSPASRKIPDLLIALWAIAVLFAGTFLLVRQDVVSNLLPVEKERKAIISVFSRQVSQDTGRPFIPANGTIRQVTGGIAEDGVRFLFTDSGGVKQVLYYQGFISNVESRTITLSSSAKSSSVVVELPDDLTIMYYTYDVNNPKKSNFLKGSSSLDDLDVGDFAFYNPGYYNGVDPYMSVTKYETKL